MHDRKVAIIKNKKCYMSSDYVRNIIDTYQGRNKNNNNYNHNFFKIEKSQNIDVSKDQPVLLYDKLRKRNISMENQVKKELADNFGYLNNSALKYNLLKFYSLNISNENLLKNKNNKNNNVQNRLNLSSKTFKSLDNEKRKLQINYSDKIRKKFKSNTFKKSNSKIIDNKFNKRFNSANNKLDKNELMKDDYIKKLMSNKYKGFNYDNIKRKKEYLDTNFISYENIEIVKEEKKDEKKEKRRVKIFENGKYIKTKKKDKKVNEVNNNDINERRDKKKICIKNVVDGFEYINKIKNERKNLKSPNNKNNK